MSENETDPSVTIHGQDNSPAANLFQLGEHRADNHIVDEQHLLQGRLVGLRQKHRDLDDSITALGRAGTFDQLQVQRLKKEKLIIRDEIGRIEAMLHPDIIA